MDNTQMPRRSHEKRERTTSDGFIVRPQPTRVRPHVYLDSLRTEPPNDGLKAQGDPQVIKSKRDAQLDTHGPQPHISISRRLIQTSVNEDTLELDMRVPGVEHVLRRHPIFRVGRWQFLQNKTFRTAATSLGLFLVVGGWLLGQAYLDLRRSFGDGNTAVSLQRKVDPNLLKGEGDGRVNILLLGNGGRGHQAPDLTDTIMVASIDPVNNKIALVSVPRDLWVSLPGYGSMKINAAYSTGKYDYLGKIDSSNANKKAVQAGFASVDQAVEHVLGITIHYNMVVNFASFKKVVDTLGGVSVNVPETLHDPTMAWENGWNSVLAKEGAQIFNGKQALLYVRSRHTSSDFARSTRQRLVINAIKDKAVTLGTLSNPLKISSLVKTFGNNVRTDLSITDAGRAYELIKNVPDKAITSIGLTDKNSNFLTTGWAGGQSIVRPIAGLSNYDDIQRYIRQQLPDGYIIKEGAKLKVLNATPELGFEQEVADNLKTYGYKVPKVGKYHKTITNTQIIDVSKGKKYTKNYLERRFGVNVKKKLPRGIQRGGADFIIILGNNETTRQ